MSTFIIHSYEELWSFLKNPKEHRDQKSSLTNKLKTCWAIYLIQLPLLMILMAILSGLESLGLWEEDMHAMEQLFKEMDTPRIFFLTVLIAPLFEESLFRLIIRFKRNFFITGYLTIMTHVQSTTNFARLKKYKKYWDGYYPWIFYSYAVLFGLMHIMNFEPSLTIYLLTPIIVAPQILIGLNLGYIRIKFGLIWSMIFHSFYNGTLIIIALLSGEL